MISPERPSPGFYRTRLVRNGPWVPARIIEADGLWIVLLNGQPTQPEAGADPWRVRRMELVAFSTAISEAEYHDLLAHPPEPGTPLDNPKTPVDWRRGKPLF